MARYKPKAEEVRLAGKLLVFKKLPSGKYFLKLDAVRSLKGAAFASSATFLLSDDKAKKLMDADGNVPMRATIQMSGRKGKGEMVLFAKIETIDGQQLHAWTAQNTAARVSKLNAKVSADAQRIEDEMRDMAPPESPSPFKTPQEAYSTAMSIVLRKFRTVDPKLTRAEAMHLRNALNTLRASLEDHGVILSA